MSDLEITVQDDSEAVFYSVALLAQGWHWVVAPLSVHLPALWAVVTFFQKILLTTRNGLFVRFPFLGMGMLFAFYKIEMSMKKAVCGFAVSGFLMFLEAFFIKFFHLAVESEVYIFLVPTTFFLFYIAKNVQLKEKGIHIVLRQLSSLIFFLHLWVDYLISKVSINVFHYNIQATVFRCITVLIVTTLVSLGIIKLSNQKNLRWLKKLYS